MNSMDPEQLAQALGIPLFRTPYFLPTYPEGDQGAWRLSRTATGIDHGYYTPQWVIAGMPVLLRRSPDHADQWETWMSLSPHEIESQEPGCLCASGHTVIMGLGMGWIALNAALNPAVQRVTVVERDRDVIDLFTAAGIADQVPPGIKAKIVIDHADALAWLPQEPIDFLYADIWREITDAGTLSDVRRMQQQVRAREVYFWGQELWLFDAFARMFGPGKPLTIGGLQQCIDKELTLPLALPWGEGYGDRIEAAVRNRRNRQLPLVRAGIDKPANGG